MQGIHEHSGTAGENVEGNIIKTRCAGAEFACATKRARRPVSSGDSPHDDRVGFVRLRTRLTETLGYA
jgi:hypothetical protein